MKTRGKKAPWLSSKVKFLTYCNDELKKKNLGPRYHLSGLTASFQRRKRGGGVLVAEEGTETMSFTQAPKARALERG